MMNEEDKQKMELLKELFGKADIKASQIVFGHGVYVEHVEHVDNHYHSSTESSDETVADSQAEVSPLQEAKKECPWIEDILNSFYGDVRLALEFVRMIQHMKPVQIVALVNAWIKQKKISSESCNRDLWKPLHEHGLYKPSEANWNNQVQRPSR